MKAILITYDLYNEKEYPDLYEAIRKLGTNRRILLSVWIVKSKYSAQTIREYLSNYIDSDDALFVTELLGYSSWVGLDSSISDWLVENL